jgi:hypothetical protein
MVQKGGPNVASRRTTQRSIDGGNIQERIGGTTRTLNRSGKALECLGGIGGTVVDLSIVVLDFLQGQDVRRVEVVYDLLAESGPLDCVIVPSAQVQHIVGRHGESFCGAGQPGRIRPEAPGKDSE